MSKGFLFEKRPQNTKIFLQKYRGIFLFRACPGQNLLGQAWDGQTEDKI